MTTASSQQSVFGSAPSSGDASDSAPSSDECAEIPVYPHVVLVATVKLAIRFALPREDASRLPHKLTLSSDDGSYSRTLSLASDAQPGDDDGTSLLVFDHLSEQHTYSVACDDGETTYSLLADVPYDELVKDTSTESHGELEPIVLQPLPANDASRVSTPAPASDASPDSSGDVVVPDPDSRRNAGAVST